MSKYTSDFFETKKEWSKIKDELLACYLKPYMQKIMFTRLPVNYIDCFAGKGKFADGNDGSPLIALKIIEECKETSSVKNLLMRSYFIEEKYGDELSENLIGFNNIEIIKHTYVDSVKSILQNKSGQNLFLYIDPYGVKCLDFNLFRYFTQVGANSVEVLLNFNSFGFIREACRVLKADDGIIKSLDDIIVEIVDSSFYFNFSNLLSISELDAVAGGNYWQEILRDYISEKFDCYEAERKITTEFCKRLQSFYKYVVNMPIRLKAGGLPKYRMIHMTNNEDGCILMFKNICKRFEHLVYIQTQKQGLLFEFDESPENEIIDEIVVKQKICEFLKNCKEFVHLNVFISKFITENGIICKPQNIINILKKLEEENMLIVRRFPELKQFSKEKRVFWEEKRNQSVEIRSI
ncbi:MAG: three-Cys-motif partner protein TcmP [Treponemataceae bacterium]|nr:three-Cys-motif partner protein TcmP [Treponemataceae bacterium]